MCEEQKSHQLFRKQNFIYCKVPETVNTLSEVQWTGTISLKCWTCLPGTAPGIFKRDLKPWNSLVQGPPSSLSPASTTSRERAVNFYLHFLPNCSQDSPGRSQAGIHPFVFRDPQTKGVRNETNHNANSALDKKKKERLFYRTFSLMTIKSIASCLKRWT